MELYFMNYKWWKNPIKIGQKYMLNIKYNKYIML
jgi:hypothetical protein